MAGSKEQRPYAGKSDERKVSAVSNVQPQILSDSNQSVVAFRLPISTLQRLLTSMTRTRAHGLHRIPVLAPQEFWRHERPVCGELLTYAGMSDVALRCRTVEYQLLRRANWCCRPQSSLPSSRIRRCKAVARRNAICATYQWRPLTRKSSQCMHAARVRPATVAGTAGMNATASRKREPRAPISPLNQCWMGLRCRADFASRGDLHSCLNRLLFNARFAASLAQI